jgi:AraC-like DNA-binding protein
MEFEFFYHANRVFSFDNGIPEDFEGPLITGSLQSHFKDEEGCIIKQELKYKNFCFSFFSFSFSKKISINCKLPHGLQSLLLYKNDCTVKISNDVNHLKDHQYILFYNRGSACKFDFKKSGVVQLIHVTYEDQYISELLPAFLDQEAILTGEKERTEIVAAQQAILDCLRQILYADYEPLRLPYYFKNKVDEYLFLLIDQNSKQSVKIKPAEHELEAIYKVRDMIMADILKHHSINQLARKNKINSNRLKLLFKNEFGIGPYRFLLNARLEKVKQLMDEGMPMKVAAPLAGYNLSSFITAVKKIHGYSPGKMKKRGDNFG